MRKVENNDCLISEHIQLVEPIKRLSRAYTSNQIINGRATSLYIFTTVSLQYKTMDVIQNQVKAEFANRNKTFTLADTLQLLSEAMDMKI